MKMRQSRVLKKLRAGEVVSCFNVHLDAQVSEYYHLIVNAGQASYHVEVKDAAWAVNGKFSGD